MGCGNRPLVGNGFTTHLTAELSGEIADALRAGVSRWLSIRAVGGAVNDVAALATAPRPGRPRNVSLSVTNCDRSFRELNARSRRYLKSP